ncbi:hypothetical protein GCM10027610_089080 [Dactylosporangium cerinum]
MHEPAARVVRQRARQRQQAAPVPADDRVQVVDDQQRLDPRVFEGGVGGVAEAEPADDDLERTAGQRGQSQRREGDLSDGEEAGHEVFVAELHLVHLDLEGRIPPTAEADLADRGLLPVELFEPPGHRGTVSWRRAPAGRRLGT